MTSSRSSSSGAGGEQLRMYHHHRRRHPPHETFTRLIWLQAERSLLRCHPFCLICPSSTAVSAKAASKVTQGLASSNLPRVGGQTERRRTSQVPNCEPEQRTQTLRVPLEFLEAGWWALLAAQWNELIIPTDTRPAPSLPNLQAYARALGTHSETTTHQHHRWWQTCQIELMQ